MVNRRFFLKLLGYSGLGLLIGNKINYRLSSNVLEFYVSGVRFQSDSPKVNVGDSVTIKKEIWQQERCYGIFDKSSIKMGFVPRNLISTLDRSSISYANLVSVNINSIPWKRYKVAIKVTQEV